MVKTNNACQQVLPHLPLSGSIAELSSQVWLGGGGGEGGRNWGKKSENEILPIQKNMAHIQFLDIIKGDGNLTL